MGPMDKYGLIGMKFIIIHKDNIDVKTCTLLTKFVWAVGRTDGHSQINSGNDSESDDYFYMLQTLTQNP